MWCVQGIEMFGGSMRMDWKGRNQRRGELVGDDYNYFGRGKRLKRFWKESRDVW